MHRDSALDYSGLEIETVSRFSGRAVSDSSRTSSGRTMFTAVLHRVCNKEGIAADANQEAVVILDTPEEKVFCGEEFTAEGEYFQGDEGACFFFVSAESFHFDRWQNSYVQVRAGIMNHVFQDTNRAGRWIHAGIALVLGNRDYLTSREVELFRQSGSMHLLALSGMHLGFIGLLSFALFLPVLGKYWAALPALILCICFTFFIGASPSLLRATLFLCTAFLFSRLPVPFSKIQILGAALFFLGFLFPHIIGSIGFWLSFGAVFAIILFSQKIRYLLCRVVPPSIAGILATGISIQIVLSPIMLIVFGEIYWGGIFSTFIATPLLIFLMAGTVVYSLCTFCDIGFLVTSIDTALEAVTSLLYGILDVLTVLPALTWNSPVLCCIVLTCSCYGICYTGKKLILHSGRPCELQFKTGNNRNLRNPRISNVKTIGTELSGRSQFPSKDP